MSGTGRRAAERFAAAAEALEGTKFRLHGRTRAGGLDCIGLAALALADCGREVRAPQGYALRNSDIARHLRLAASNGFADTGNSPARGDLLLVRAGPAQCHLLVACGGGRFVHAHAGSRRVVRDRGLPDAAVLRHWRLIEE